MFTTFQRAGILTAALCMAAGATALAAVTIEPSSTITLATHGRGMLNGDLEREITITVRSNSGKIQIAENGCSALVTLTTVSSSDAERHGSDQAPEANHHTVFHIKSKSTSEGTCTVRFSGGSHTATAHIRIVKP